MKKTMILLLTLAVLLCGCGKEESPAQVVPETEPAAAGTQPQETVEIPEGQEAVTEPPTDTVTVILLARMARLDENGNELWHMEYSYDELGRLCAEREILSDGQESYSVVITYVETESGWEKIYTTPGGDSHTIRETLDENGNVILSENIHDGYVDYYTEYTYDEEGRLTADESHYSEDPGVPRTEYTYDALGRLISICQYSSGELYNRQEITYDDASRCAETLFYNADGVVSSRFLHTWEGNTETRTEFDGEGNLYQTVVITYDDAGNILREETSPEAYDTSCFEYTYEPFEIPAGE